jgi:hypothetical protein
MRLMGLRARIKIPVRVQMPARKAFALEDQTRATKARAPAIKQVKDVHPMQDAALAAAVSNKEAGNGAAVRVTHILFPKLHEQFSRTLAVVF